MHTTMANLSKCGNCARRLDKTKSIKEFGSCVRCGKTICDVCASEVATCGTCDEQYCRACKKALWTDSCPRCKAAHHRQCASQRRCAGCGAYACEHCEEGESPFVLCESCDAAYLCDACARTTVGDETDDYCACPRCDTIGPRIEAMELWSSTRQMRDETIKIATWFVSVDRPAVADLLRKEYPRFALAEAIALDCLQSAVRGSDVDQADLVFHVDEIEPGVRRRLLRAVVRNASERAQDQLVMYVQRRAAERAERKASGRVSVLADMVNGGELKTLFLGNKRLALWERRQWKELRAALKKIGLPVGTPSKGPLFGSRQW